MTTPTTPITASVGEPTPIPERPTLYSILTPYHDGSWGLTSPSKVPYRVNEKDKPGSVLVTIPGTRDASYTAELDNYDGLASEEASPTTHATHDRLFYERVRKVLDELRPGWMDDVEASNHDLVEQAIRSLASPTAPRAEGRVRPCGCVVCVCNDDNKCRGCGAKSCATHASPPRDRCEVCGGSGWYGGTRGYPAYPCPTCTKETPCESGSGSSAASSATSSPQKPASQSPVVDANTSNPNGSASNRATVTGEGPYRVAYERANRMFYVVKPDGERTCFGKRSIAQHAANLANHAHHTTLAVREAEVVRLRKALEPFAKFAGSKFAGTVWEDRPSSPVLFHSFTGSSVTANDFYAARDALKGAAR
jgi:hypothetical protein